jgi:hypothetical protein
MSTAPQAPPPPPPAYDRPYYGPGMPGIPSPTGELAVFLVAWVVTLIVTLAADSVGWEQFVRVTALLAAAYILSRGIAKAGKVVEGR